MRLLLVEDDDLFGRAVETSLRRAGYAVDWVTSGQDAMAAMATHHYDGAVLDLGLPDMQGQTLLEWMKLRNARMPILIMTARGGAQDRITLLDGGADDFMVKPVDLDEVCARLRAISRRVHATHHTGEELQHGEIRLVPSRRLAMWRHQPVDLSNKEFGLLETFVRRKHQVLTRAQLEESLYGWGEETSSNTVEVYIHFLRRKFRPSLIETVRGVGYRLGSTTLLDS